MMDNKKAEPVGGSAFRDYIINLFYFFTSIASLRPKN